MDTIIFLVALLALIVVSAFFSGSETSMMSLNRYRLRHLGRRKHKAAQRALHLLKRPDRLLGTILIGNTFANILASSLATVLATHLFGDWGIAIGTLILTLIILMFAEVMPKTIAAVYPEKFAFPVSLPLKWIHLTLYPIVILINGFTNSILRLLGLPVNKAQSDALSLEEIRSVVRASSNTLAKRYQNMLLGVLDLQHATIEDVMVPRHQILGINLQDDITMILALISSSPFSKLPLYEDNIDQIIGVLHLKNIARLLKQPTITHSDLRKLAQKPYFIPENTILLKQLTQFQKNSEQMAFIVNEYGEIQGLATLEDLVEEIVGEFSSQEQPSVNQNTQKQADGSFIVDGLMTVRDVNRDLRIQLPTTGPKTLSGLITEHLETIPTERMSLLLAGHPIEILQVEDNAVKKAKIQPKIHPHHEPD